MAQCQCLKANGVKCTRDVSLKPGNNSLYCWQHQNCSTQSKKKIPLKIKPKKVVPQSTEKVDKSAKKCPHLSQWIKMNIFKGGQNNGWQHLPDKFYDELGCIAFGYIETKTKYMYDFWDVILHISPFPAWIEQPWKLDQIYDLMQKDDKLIYELREAFEKDGGHLPYSKDIYTEDDLIIR